jgi:hypothetical protein
MLITRTVYSVCLGSRVSPRGRKPVSTLQNLKRCFPLHDPLTLRPVRLMFLGSTFWISSRHYTGLENRCFPLQDPLTLRPKGGFMFLGSNFCLIRTFQSNLNRCYPLHDPLIFRPRWVNVPWRQVLVLIR